ncbi:DUF1080 domain-containing protein [Lewinella sp. IMCC34183]|uniref:3-keto-disaccharide hydrolase n=1 Tax=Lewinella sp. IMCC34183 TaxID=2248762 RepID=UPI000E244E7C|nr:DUF1080 domain-containing protein [Lewinella sp. IMCC34183]
MNRYLRPCYGLLVLLVATACSDGPPPATAEAEAPSADTTTSEWITLFDGTSTEGWRGYNAEVLPPGWVARDGMLQFDTEVVKEEDYTGGKDIIYGDREFDNFELELDWKIPPGGNSGILYHVKEGYGGPPEVAPEYQLIDDEHYADMHDLSGYNGQFGVAHPEQLQDWQSTGADYAMYTPDPDKKQLNPAGEWNSSRIVFTPERVEHWLNGELLLSFEPWSDDWKEKRNSGKWKGAPDYGKFRTGYIALQDHGSPLWFRNIRIREL